MTGATPAAPRAPAAPSLGKPEMKRTREGFGHGLVDLGEKRPEVVVLVGDLSGSTNVTFFAEKFPARFIQVDCVRVGGVSEFITISLLARKFGAPVVPHVGDMGQIHQHLVLFNHIALGHEAVFLEYIPHLREHFAQPAEVAGGVYRIPEVPGSSSDLKD